MPRAGRRLGSQPGPDPGAAQRSRANLGRPADRRRDRRSEIFVSHADAEHYATAFSEVYKQAVTPDDAIEHIAIINELSDDSVKLVFSDRGEDGAAQLTWFLGGHTASLSQLLPMLQSMGVVVLEERPFTVTRPDGLPVWIYQFKISPHPDHPAGVDGGRTGRDRAAIRRRGHRDLAGPRRDRPVQRAGDAREADLAAGRAAARLREVPTAGRLSLQPVPHRIGAQRAPLDRAVTGHVVRGAFRPRAVGSPTSRDAQAAAAAVAADIDALVSLDTDRILRAFASLVQATLRTNYFVTHEGSARGPQCARR